MDSQVQEIKDKLSIQDVVGEYVKLERAGRNMRARCPFHKEKTPSFMISPERGSYICFGCGEKGDIFTFVEKIEHIDFKTALQQLATKAGVVLKNTYVPRQEDKEKEEQLRDVSEDATAFFQDELKKRSDVLEYLKEKRGVTDETIESWRIGYAPAHWRDLSEYLIKKGYSKDLIIEAGLAVNPARSDLATNGGGRTSPDSIYDRFRGRIMFPLFDAGGKVIAFSGRFFEEMEGEARKAQARGPEGTLRAPEPRAEPAKYVNSPETPIFKKSRVLYGLDKAKNFIRKADCVLLVEGQFDVIMSHQSGLPFAVASSGTAITEEHLSLLSRYSKRLVLALDGDAAGIRAGLKSAQMALKMGFDVKIPNFKDGKDPADIAKEDSESLKQAIRTSKASIEFFLDVLRPQARDERAYAKLVEAQVVPLIAAIQSKIEQAHFTRTVAGRLRVPEAAIHAEVIKRPVLSINEVEGDTPAAVETGNQPSSLERTAALLLFYDTDESTKQRVETLLGASRKEHIEHAFADGAEKFRFEFESLGEDKNAIVAELLEVLERGLIDEEMARVRDELYAALPEAQGMLMQKLATLKKRQQELRK
ncbi:toprim domain-containing protein [Patescibacteria group bacterium]|nr:toprim domain-containing protein [Patescibacteria group bacterium]